MFRKLLLSTTTATMLLAGHAAAQTCAPTALPLGQPGLVMTFPACSGAMPLPLPAGGNAGFGISSFMPMVPPGSPTILLISGFSPPPFLPIPAGLLCGGYGLPGTIPFPVPGFPIVVPAGPAGPLPGAPVPIAFPGPEIAPPGSVFVAIQSLALVVAPGALPCIAISDGITVTN